LRIVLVTPHFCPDIGASAPIYTALAEDLHKKGHDVTVVTAFPHYGRDSLPAEYRGRWFQMQDHDGIQVLRGFVYVGRKSSAGRRLLSYLSLNLSAMISLFRLPTPDVAITHSPILMIGLPVLALRILKGVPFVYHVQDVYPDVAIQSGALRPGVFASLLACLERATYRLGAAIPVISEGFVELMVDKGVARNKIALIPNCVDTDLIRPLPRLTPLRRQLGLDSKFVVLYAGNIGFGQGLEAVIEAASLLVNQTSIHFLMVGEGATLESLKGMVRQMALPNVTFIGFQPRENVPDVLATADISLAPLKKGIALRSVPSKVWSIMASGRPMIISVDDTSDTYRIVTTVGAGIAVEPENPEALCQAIQSMYTSRASLEMMGVRGRAYVESNLGRCVAANRFEELLQQVVRQ